jgi:hypothetical protein
VVVGVLQEPGIDLHLPGQHRLELLVHVLPGRDLVMAAGQLSILGDDPELLLAGEGLLALGVPAVVEAALVTVGPLGRDVVGLMGRARGEVDEERLVSGQGLLLADPGDRLVGQIRHQVIAVLGGAPGLDRGGVLVQGRIPLVGLTGDEPIEVLEATPRAGPAVERAVGAGLPHRDLVALAELGGGIAVQAQGLGQGGAGVGPHRGVAGRGGGHLGDPAHAHRVVVAA